MVVGSYRPRWVALDAGGRALIALTFVVRRDHPQYTGKLSRAQQVASLACATGAFGSSADYLERTRVALIAHGIADPYLEDLAVRVVAHRAASTQAPP
jgi:cation transport protein ChaC